jgi:hypothetical protein
MREIDKIENSIALHQGTIDILEKIKERVETSETEEIRIKIETKHWYGFSEPFLAKEKHKLDMSRYSANVLLETAIKLEKERINKLIDMEIEKRQCLKGADNIE